MLRKRNPPRGLAVRLQWPERRFRPGVKNEEDSRNQLMVLTSFLGEELFVPPTLVV
jgi:hypothetical protein